MAESPKLMLFWRLERDMKPFLEKISGDAGSSWALLDRRLADGIPFEWHHHPEYELTLTLNSRGFRYVGDSVEAYEDGDLTLLGPHLPHSWHSQAALDAQHPHVALVAWFGAAWLAQLAALFPELQRVTAMTAAAHGGLRFSPAAARSVRPLIETFPALAPDQRLLALLDVLRTLSWDTGAAALASPAPDGTPALPPADVRLERILDHLHRHYAEPIAIDTLAGLACLSVSAFHRLFRRQTRMTALAYVARLRIGRACALLLGDKLAIAAIATAVGYDNLAQFNQQFRRLKKMTPREFKKLHSRAPDQAAGPAPGPTI
jgi:AraC-like DNA-binding protein